MEWEQLNRPMIRRYRNAFGLTGTITASAHPRKGRPPSVSVVFHFECFESEGHYDFCRLEPGHELYALVFAAATRDGCVSPLLDYIEERTDRPDRIGIGRVGRAIQCNRLGLPCRE